MGSGADRDEREGVVTYTEALEPEDCPRRKAIELTIQRARESLARGCPKCAGPWKDHFRKGVFKDCSRSSI